MKRVALVGVVLCGVLLCGMQYARAATYDVNAVVPYDIPTFAATFTSGLNGSTTSNRVIELSGTCEFVEPASVVAVYRQGTFVGSTNCLATDAYVLSITLADGVNELIARTYNMNYVFGPDSTAITITYVAATALPSEPTAQSAVQNASSDLSIVTESPFQVVDSTNRTVKLSVVVSGGATPYTIEINWGDGSVESKQVAEAGTYTFTHDYAKAATYRAMAKVTDVLGTSRELRFVVVAPGALAATSEDTTNLPNSQLSTRDYVPYFVASGAVIVLITGVAIGMVLGRRTSTARVAKVVKTARSISVRKRRPNKVASKRKK